MKILITGAHFTPAQAVIEQLLSDGEKHNLSPLEIVYVGRKTTIEGDSTPSVESQVLPKLGIKFIPITTGRMRRIIEFKTLTSLLKVPLGFIQGFKIIASEKPDVVLSFGGYVAVPIVVNAWLFRIPIIVHEQTLVTGLANSISSHFATKIAVSFESDYDFPKDKVIVTGNPFRQELLTKPKEVAKEVQNVLNYKLPIIYVTGGNQGSHQLNQQLQDILPELTKKAVVIHQTGDSKFNDYQTLVDKKADLEFKDHYLVKKWFQADEVSAIYRQAKLVISRAGANTLLELAFFAIPTIVIPLPFFAQR